MSLSFGKKKKHKLLIIASHPIQYQCPLFREIAKCSEIDLTVYFCSDWGVKEYFDKGFGKTFSWDVNLLDGFNYKFLKNYSFCPNLSTFWGAVNWDLIRKLKKENYDAVWIHGWNNFSNLLAVFVCFLRGIPVLLRGETNLLPQLPKYKAFLKRLLLSNLFKKVSAFLAIGTYNKEFYIDHGVPSEKIFLVPYTINNAFFTLKANELISQKEKLKEKHNIPKNVPVILFSGKLTDVKNPMLLLEAYKELSKEIELALVFIGDGYLRKEMEKYINDNNLKNVYIMGFRNQSELPEFYAMSDVFVLPSNFEPWGLVVNEAMCFGLPIIVSDQVGASGDLVAVGENGYVFETKNITMLATYLKQLLQDEMKKTKFGQYSKKLIENWSYKEDIKGLLDSLNKNVINA